MFKADGKSKNSQFSHSLHESNLTESLSSNLVASTVEILESAGIPQVDGTTDFTLTEVTDIGIEETEKLCNFCNEEFENNADFIEYMKKFGFLCNNCLDYFSDKTWFCSSDLTWIGSGSVLRQHQSCT